MFEKSIGGNNATINIGKRLNNIRKSLKLFEIWEISRNIAEILQVIFEAFPWWGVPIASTKYSPSKLVCESIYPLRNFHGVQTLFYTHSLHSLHLLNNVHIYFEARIFTIFRIGENIILWCIYSSINKYFPRLYSLIHT